MNCHNQIKTASPALAVVRDSYQTGKPVPWVHVHVMPSFVYFDHSIHVNRGISCVECHGKVNEMDVVTQEKPMSMGFCLDCHRAPEEHVREKADVFNLDSKTIAAAQGIEAGRKFVHDWNINPPAELLGLPPMKRKVVHPEPSERALNGPRYWRSLDELADDARLQGRRWRASSRRAPRT